jgi:hypothetical protein
MGRRPEESLLSDTDLRDAYVNRLSDKQIPDIFKVRPGKYIKYCAPLTLEHIKCAPRTGYHYILRVIIQKILSDPNYALNPGCEIDLTINTYPFNLKPSELKAFSESMAHLTPMINTCSYVSLPLESISLAYVSSNYSTYMLYRLNEWLTIIQDEIADSSDVGLNIIAPKLYHDKIPTKAELLDSTTDVLLDPFEANAFLLSTAFSLEFIPIKFLSYDANL